MFTTKFNASDITTCRENAGAHLQLRTNIFPLLLQKLFQSILPSITAQLREERRWTCKRNKKEGRTQGRIVQIKCRHLMNQGSFNRSVFLHHTAQTCMYCIICYELCCTIFYFFLKLLKIIRFVHWKGIKKVEGTSSLYFCLFLYKITKPLTALLSIKLNQNEK